MYPDVPSLTAKRNWPWQSSLTHEFVEQRKVELLAWLQLLLADEMISGLWPLKGFLSERRNIPPPGVLQPETAVDASGGVSRSPSHSREERETVGPESFSQIKLLGTGASGTVIQVRQNNTGNIYAMKVRSHSVALCRDETMTPTLCMVRWDRSCERTPSSNGGRCSGF